MTNEQLRAAIMDIVTDAWDRSRQIDGAVDEIMDAVALAAQHPSQSDYEAVLADHKRLVRELDVLLNGEDGAAQQAFLVDLVAQVRRQGIRAALPSQSALPPEIHGLACNGESDTAFLAGLASQFPNGPIKSRLIAITERPSQSAGEPVVNRATVIEWLDALDIEVTDRQMDGLFHASPPPTDAARVEADGISALVAEHARLIEEGNNHAYFELANAPAREETGG